MSGLVIVRNPIFIKSQNSQDRAVSKKEWKRCSLVDVVLWRSRVNWATAAEGSCPWTVHRLSWKEGHEKGGKSWEGLLKAAQGPPCLYCPLHAPNPQPSHTTFITFAALVQQGQVGRSTSRKPSSKNVEQKAVMVLYSPIQVFKTQG